MDQETFSNLKPGDRIMLKSTGKTYTVEGAGTHKGDKAHRVRCEDGTATEAFYAPLWDLVPPPETAPGPVSDPHTVPVRVAARLWHATPEEAECITNLLADMDALARVAALERRGLRNIAEAMRRGVLGPPDPGSARDTLEELVRTLDKRLSEATRELTKLRKERDEMIEECNGVRRARSRLAAEKHALRMELDTAKTMNALFAESNGRRETTLIEQARLTDEARKAAEEMRARLADAAEHTFSWEDEQEDNG